MSGEDDVLIEMTAWRFLGLAPPPEDQLSGLPLLR